ncbi:amiloride-sensitive sodium channel subunit beta-like [Argopecten irradians]|uniref:amiloride-sensitive sodium channel subunit beta-like n=1 Tax=Argopecten irradians TaxID=31199 RepID=UPI00371B976B
MKEKKSITDVFSRLHSPENVRIHNIKVSPRPTRKRSISDTLKSIRTINEAPADNKKEKKKEITKETVGSIFTSLGEGSSVHGVSRVLSGSSRRRAMWLLFIITFLTYFLYQFYGILTYYYSYPIKTVITIESRPLLLPAITICNTNPIRMSQIRESGTRIMRKLMEIDGFDDDRNTSAIFGGRDTFQELLDSMRNASDTVYDAASFDISDDDIGHAIVDDLEGLHGNVMPEELDELYILNQKLQQEYDSLTREQRIEMGHEIDKMVLRCTFAGRNCKRPKRIHVSNEYGNCFTFESSSYVATRSGPEFGFQIILNLETHEAIPHLTSGFGARLVMHQYGSLPLPAEEGITLSPSYETAIGIRMTKITRLGQPHGTCAVPHKFFRKRMDNNASYHIRYSSQACVLDCKEAAIERECDCYESNIHDELYTGFFSRSQQMPHCAESVDDFRCATSVTREFLTGAKDCHCPNACDETVYSRFFSGRLWPSDEYLEGLLEQACSRYDQTVKPCPLYRFSRPQLRMNFLRINIYYEDLNFEFLSEEPEYELMNLLSDVGGSLGLFLGASVLSLGEIIELLIELIYFFIKKRRNH